MVQRYYVICLSDDKDFSLWRSDNGIAPMFRTKTGAFNFIRKQYGNDKNYRRYLNEENATTVEVCENKEARYYLHRFDIVPCDLKGDIL